MEQNSSNKRLKTVLISCFLAACLEMYDFAIFGFLATIIHRNYLSFLDDYNGLIITYTLFAVGFLFRPLGSMIFGYIGDVYGRKKALILSVTFMGSSSLALALLPNFASIGIISCYLIALIRVVQGLSVGGEYSGAIIYAIEHFDRKRAGMVGGIIIGGCVTGVLLASSVSALVQNDFMPSYSWRFAFLLGFGLSVIGFFIRQNLIETPEFTKLSVGRIKMPLWEGVKHNGREAVASTLMAATCGMNFYFILVFLPKYFNGLAALSITWWPIVTTSLLIIFSPLLSTYSDYVNRAKLIQAGALALSIFSVIGLKLTASYASFTTVLIFFVIQALLFSILAGSANVYIVEIFPVRYRYSCAAFFYSIGLGIVGGTSPLVASLITQQYVNKAPLILSLYMGGICLMSFFAVRWQQGKSKATIAVSSEIRTHERREQLSVIG